MLTGDLLSVIAENWGITAFSYRETKTGLSLSRCVYYEGARMLHAWRTGNSSFLSSREKQALAVAEQIVAMARGDDLSKERYLHDVLCQRTAYQTEDGGKHQDRDCAIGPLLNGMADCDGYSDAFYLLGNMAGLEVRHLHGTAVSWSEDGAEAGKSGSHMWNLIRINGRWMMLDVTWDDTNESPNYNYFNFGSDQAAASHSWDERGVTVEIVSAAGNESRPADLARTQVNDWDAVYGCLRSAALNRAGRICLSFPQGMDLRRDRETLNRLIRGVGAKDYSWAFSSASAEVFDIVYASCFAICESIAEAEEFLRQCADENVSAFRLCFGPYFGPQMMADERKAISALLTRSALISTQYMYSSESWYIEITGAAYTAEPPRFDTLSSLIVYAQQQAALHAGRFTVALMNGLGVNAAVQPVADALYRLGVDSISTSWTGVRLTFELSYYPEFAVVRDRTEARQYLEGCRNRGVGALRIYFPEALFAELHANRSEGFFALLKSVGIKNPTIYYSDSSFCFILEDILW